jgi:hypothetical protein
MAKKTQTSTPALPQEPRLMVLTVTLASLAAATSSRYVIAELWHLATGRKPPIDVTDPGVRAREALLWSVLTGATAGVARMAVRRQASNYFLKSTSPVPATGTTLEVQEPPSTEVGSGS